MLKVGNINIKLVGIFMVRDGVKIDSAVISCKELAFVQDNSPTYSTRETL